MNVINKNKTQSINIKKLLLIEPIETDNKIRLKFLNENSETKIQYFNQTIDWIREEELRIMFIGGCYEELKYKIFVTLAIDFYRSERSDLNRLRESERAERRILEENTHSQSEASEADGQGSARDIRGGESSETRSTGQTESSIED